MPIMKVLEKLVYTDLLCNIIIISSKKDNISSPSPSKTDIRYISLIIEGSNFSFPLNGFSSSMGVFRSNNYLLAPESCRKFFCTSALLYLRLSSSSKMSGRRIVSRISLFILTSFMSSNQIFLGSNLYHC